MANYPCNILNKINILSSNGEKISIEQNITMHDDIDEQSKVLFDFQEISYKKDGVFNQSIAKVIQENDKNYLELNLKDKVNKLPEGIDQDLVEMLSKDHLEINCPPPALSMESRGSEIIVSISSKDGRPYTISIGASTIKFQYQDKEGKDSCAIINLDPKESHINISMQRKVVEEMIKGDNPLYKPTKIQAISTKDSIPQSLLYLYFQGIAENSSVNIGKYEICQCNFNNNDPYFFVKRENDTLLYTNGGFKKCSNFFFQHDTEPNSQPALIIEGSGSKNRPYYNVPISNEEKFNKAFQLMCDSAELQYHDIRTEKLKPQDGPRQIDNEIIKERIKDPYSFNGDIREYASHKFDYRTKNIDQTQINEASKDEGNVIYNNLFIINSNMGNQTVNHLHNSNIDEGGDSGADEKPVKETDVDKSAPEDTQGIASNSSQAPQESEADATQNADAQPTPTEDKPKAFTKKHRKHIEPRGPRQRGEKKEFKDTAEAVGNTLMGVGIWLGICCMIPGVNIIAAFVAIGLVVGGGLLNTYADKIAYRPFLAAERKVREYEQEEADNAEFKEQFIENEHTLENYHALSNEKIATLENMMSAPENGGNFVAHTFANIYNQNGANFVRREGQAENYGVQSLNSLESLQLKQNIANDLQRIRTETNAYVKSQLINNFSLTYFTSLSHNQTREIEHMFTSDHDQELAQFIAALNEANKAQTTENTLYQSQKNEITNANEKRIRYLFSHAELSPEERIHFIDRYGQTILQNYSMNGNTSYEKIENLIDSLPPKEREAAALKFNQVALATREKFNDLSLIANAQHDKTEALNNLVQYQKEIVSTSNEENYAFFSQCQDATIQFLNSYTNQAYSKSREKFAEKFTFQKDGKTILPAISNPNEVVMFKRMESFIGNIIQKDKNIKENEELITYQKVKNELFKEFYSQEVAQAYIEDRKNKMGLDGIAPNSTLLAYSKSNSTEEIASRLAKQDILQFLESYALAGNENKDEEIKKLSKLSLIELASRIKLPEEKEEGKSENSQQLIAILSNGEKQIKRYPAKDVSQDYIKAFDKARNAAIYASACKGYNDLYVDKVIQISHELEQLSQTKSNVEIVEKNGKIIFSYKSHDKNGNVITTKSSLAIFTMRYPHLRNLPLSTQKNIVSTLLNANFKYTESLKEKITETDPKQAAAHQERLERYQNTYKMAGNLALSIMQGNYQDALYHATYLSSFGGEEISYAKDSAKRLNQSIKAHIHTNEVLQAFSEEQNAQLKEFFESTAKASPDRTAASIIKEGLEKYVGISELKTGAKYYDIVNRYFPEAVSDKEKIEAFDKFIKENQELIEKQTELTASCYYSNMGKEFVDKEIRRQYKGIDDKTIPTYNNYIQLFTDFGLDKDKIAQTFAEAESFQSAVDSLLKDAGVSEKDIKNYKIKKDKIKISQFDDVTKNLYNLYKERYNLNETYNQYDQIVNNLISHDIDPQFNKETLEKLQNLDKDLLAKAGIDINEALGIISKEEFSKEDLDKLTQILANNTKQYTRSSTKMTHEISREKLASQAVGKEDRESILAKDDYIKYHARTSRFKECFGKVCDFIKNNPNNSEIDKILNAFAEGDKEFFEINSVIDFEGVDDIDIAVFESAGINLNEIKKLGKIKNKDKLVKKLQALSDKFSRQMQEEENELKKKAQEKEAKARAVKDKKVETKIDSKKKTSILKDLPLLAKLFQRKAQKEAEIRIAREAAQEEIDKAKAQARKEKETQENAQESEAETPTPESTAETETET